MSLNNNDNQTSSSTNTPSSNFSFKIGFKINKAIKPKTIIQPLKLSVDEQVENKVDYVTSIDNNQIKGDGITLSQSTSGELVIPLITVNKYKLKRKIDDKPTDSTNLNDDDITSQAKKELLEEAKKLNDNVDDESSIPSWKLMVINKVPDEYESDDKLDVSLRPEESTLEDYENVPIDGFGAALLRGMGWKKGEAIGGVNKAVTKIFEPQLRAKGLGLGADTSIEKQMKKESTKNK